MPNDLIESPDYSNQLTPILQWAESLTIATVDQFTDASDKLKTIKAMQAEIKASYGPLKKKASEAHKAIVAEELRQIQPWTNAEYSVKQMLLDYQQAEQRKAEAERARLQALADEVSRKEREKIEQARAKQAAIEAEQRAAAEAKRREAEQATAAEKKRLLAEAEAAERKANAAQAKVEAKEQQSAAVVAPVVAVASVAPTIKGQSIRKTWRAEIIDRAAFMVHACENKRYEFLQPNDSALTAMAKSLKSEFVFPGVLVHEEVSIASSSR